MIVFITMRVACPICPRARTLQPDPRNPASGPIISDNGWVTFGEQPWVIPHECRSGERGIRGKSHDEAAAIRTAEAEAACKILGVRPVFGGQIDGATELNHDRVESLSKLVFAEEPDVVFTHWPIDTHMDHQVAGILTIRAYLAAAQKFRLYFFEVNGGFQTMGFNPTDYVDITAVREKKKAALFAHKSQNGEEVYRKHHEIMENYRGREAQVPAAEAFVSMARDTAGRLP